MFEQEKEKNLKLFSKFKEDKCLKIEDNIKDLKEKSDKFQSVFEEKCGEEFRNPKAPVDINSSLLSDGVNNNNLVNRMVNNLNRERVIIRPMQQQEQMLVLPEDIDENNNSRRIPGYNMLRRQINR